MKEKLLAELKKKFPGLSNEFLGLIADKMALKVTEDSQIEGALATLDTLPVSITDLAAHNQQEGDRRATEAANKRESTLKEKFNFVDKANPNPQKQDPPAPTENAQLTEVLNQLKAIQEERVADQKAKTREGLLAKVKAKFGENKVPDFCFAGITLEKDEDVDTAYQQVETNYNGIKQHFVDQGFKQNSVPLGGAGSNGGNGVSSLMTNYLQDNKKTEQK